jgi:hypothetical protein
MRPLIATLLFALLFCSCEKNDAALSGDPAINVTGNWKLTSSLTLPDTTWYNAVADSCTYSFAPDGTFEYTKGSFFSNGTYKVLPDGEKVKLIIIGPDKVYQFLEAERVNDSTIRIDDWLKGVASGYSSRKFVRQE